MASTSQPCTTSATARTAHGDRGRGRGEILERLNAEDPEGYMADLLDQHLEVLEKAVRGTLDDPNRKHLFHLFLAKLGPETARGAVERAAGYVMETGDDDQTETIFWEEWRRMGLAERMDWARFVEKWRAPLYDAHTFGHLAALYMDSTSNVNFSAATGISYGAVTRTVIPRLRDAGVKRVEGLFSFAR